MGIWLAELFDGRAKSPTLTLELVDFSLALEAVCEIESADNRQFVRLWPPRDAMPDQVRQLMQAGALIMSKANW
jgi:hypothetical protein